MQGFWGEAKGDCGPIEELDESDSLGTIGECERKLMSLLDKLTKKKYKEYEEKRAFSFDIYNMHLKNYSKMKEEMELQREEQSRTYKYRKIRALYGTRLTTQILKGALDEACDSRGGHDHQHADEAEALSKAGQILQSKAQQGEPDSEQSERPTEKLPFKERIIIRADASWKSVFDVFILFLVGYSCITSLFYVAFDGPSHILHRAFDWIVEVFFYLDLLLNFITEYIDPISRKPVRNLKEISLNYLTGWFIIDFLSVFPFP